MSPEIWAVFIFGIVFIIVLLVIIIFIPNPTSQQMFFLRVTLSLAGAGVAAMIPGFLQIQGQVLSFAIGASGALAVFFIIYKLNPPTLISEAKVQKPEQPLGPKPAVKINVPPQDEEALQSSEHDREATE